MEARRRSEREVGRDGEPEFDVLPCESAYRDLIRHRDFTIAELRDLVAEVADL